MNSKPQSARAPGVDIRFGQMGIVQVHLRTLDRAELLEELLARAATAPRFFDRLAVALDVSALPQDCPVGDVRAVLDIVRRAGMIPVGLTHGTGDVDALARALELPVMSPFRAQDRRAGEAAVAPVVAVAARANPAEAPAASTTRAETLLSMLHRDAMRSGQRVYARSRDLVVAASVAAGAEAIADGCVHVYGTLRGRALAGARGAAEARIFCQDFHAELVSIAGVFRVFESLPADLVGRPVQAWLDGDELHVARIGG